MNCSITIDWKTVGAFGLGLIGVILAVKITPESAKEAFANLADACKGAVGVLSAPADL